MLLERNSQSVELIVCATGSEHCPSFGSLGNVSNLVCDLLTHRLDTLDSYSCVIMADWTVQDASHILQCAVHGVKFVSEKVEGGMHTSK
jgi:hypothetical protein